MAGKRKFQNGRFQTSKRMRTSRRSFIPSGETKHFDVAFGSTAITNATAALKMSDITEGSDSTNRIGRKLTATSLHLNLAIHQTGTACAIRCVGLKLKGKYTGTVSDYLSAYNAPPSADRAYCFYDHIFWADADHTHTINKIFKMNSKLRYMSTGATDDQDGAIIFLILTSADQANDPLYEGGSRLFFKDS